MNKDMGDSQFSDHEMRKADTNIGYCNSNGSLDEFIPFTAQVRACGLFPYPFLCVQSCAGWQHSRAPTAALCKHSSSMWFVPTVI